MANNIRRAFFFYGAVKDLFLVTFDYITFAYITFDRLHHIPQNRATAKPTQNASVAVNIVE